MDEIAPFDFNHELNLRETEETLRNYGGSGIFSKEIEVCSVCLF